ncbi:hypothetical protein BDV12DRAFT_173368 [Aspergillus spectabilis]
MSYAGLKNNTELMKVLLSHGLNIENPKYNHNRSRGRPAIITLRWRGDWPLHQAW